MRRIVFSVVAAVVGLAACGGGDDTAGGGTTPGGAVTDPATREADGETEPTEAGGGATADTGGGANADVCSWFTEEMAEEVLEVDMSPAPDQDDDGCSYVATTGSSATVVLSDPSGYEIQRDAFDGTEIPGLGQAAFNSGTGLIVAVNDEIGLQIIVFNAGGGFELDQDAQLELAQLVVPNVR